MRKAPLFLLPALVGCAGADFHGVYVAFVDDLANDDPTLPVFDFNYTDAQRPVIDPTPVEWTYESVTDLSEQVMLIEIFEVADVEGDYTRVMVVDGQILLGTEQDDDTWDFAWTYRTHETITQTHTSGYAFTAMQEGQIVWTVNLDLSDAPVGVVRIDQTLAVSWDESDIWDSAEVGSNTGDTPSSSFLQHISDETPVYNFGDETDCSAAICHLGITGGEGAGGGIVLRPTDLTADEFEAVYGSGQPSGLPNFL